MSLLGYCYFYTQDFTLAAECYEQLMQKYPSYAEYRLYYSQALYNASLFPEAIAVISQVEDPKLAGQVIKLKSAIKYREEDLNNAKILVQQYEVGDPDTEINLACLDYKVNIILNRFYIFFSPLLYPLIIINII
ncbi:unnamed protein product [Dracunculus medinensis]|uniref:Tetratricopeptide repeat protein 30 n=1 Tax=Dracunculus medinensis TaxID=318479 RepID=A0A3P7SXC2_DRAME|nr:unnamed protein product [Dracunculus medinensis]